MLRTYTRTRLTALPLFRTFSSTVRNLESKSLFTKSPDDVVLTLAIRTPLCKAKKGGLKDTPSDVLLVGLLKAVKERCEIDLGLVEDIAVGMCHPPSPCYEARASAIAAGFPQHVPVQAINRLCSSGLMAIRSISDSISKGDIDIGLAVGVESMTHKQVQQFSPRPTPQFNSDEIKANQAAIDCAEPMGWTSENVAADFAISREKMDELALLSHNRASEAQKSGRFSDEIIPFKTILKAEDGSVKEVVIDKDDGIRHGSTMEGMAKARSAFPNWGKARSTGANSSQLTDGAAAALLMRRSTAEKLGLADKIIAKHVATSVVGVEPKYMGISPAFAIPKVLERTGLKLDDIDLFEVNEAFASMYVYCVEKLGLDIKKVNVNGGAIALGHPLGATGVRQVATGLAELRRRNGRILCTSMCIGSGMGAAAIFVNETAQKVAAKL